MFSVSEYFDRIEKAGIEIQENMKPVDHTIVLWWGLDGLRLNEDGTMKWVSRKQTAENEFYQPCQSIHPAQYGSLRFCQMQNMAAPIYSLALQQCCVQYQAQYPPYYYGGCCGNYLG